MFIRIIKYIYKLYILVIYTGWLTLARLGSGWLESTRVGLGSLGLGWLRVRLAPGWAGSRLGWLKLAGSGWAGSGWACSG